MENTAVLPAGVYAVTAVMKVDHPLSEWKGEIVSAHLEIEIKRATNRFRRLKERHDRGHTP
jgi:hypothetical protein